MSYRSLRAVLLGRAHWMRQNPTPGERLLWEKLRNRQLAGLKWRRQHVFEPYIVDFYCFAARLAIEVDGSAHDGREVHDAKRDGQLEDFQDIKVVRFSEWEVLNETDRVLIAIEEAALERVTGLAERGLEDGDGEAPWPPKGGTLEGRGLGGRRWRSPLAP